MEWLNHEQSRLAVDLVVLSRRPELHVLLIKRRNEPAKGEWVLPGGHVDKGERFDEAAPRELAEETGLTAPLHRLDVFDRPDRDPRYRNVSMAYVALVSPSVKPRAGSDAADIRWAPVKSLARLPFDHSEIIARACAWAEGKPAPRDS
ncbi:NUDIX hydrolase [Candidatus Woesearchaeota archaeon]|nr:NUDIX hydrolase [Candidatus Woesearchaeota archaeon]